MHSGACWSSIGKKAQKKISSLVVSSPDDLKGKVPED